jgi:hypothetical protein
VYDSLGRRQNSGRFLGGWSYVFDIGVPSVDQLSNSPPIPSFSGLAEEGLPQPFRRVDVIDF